MSDNIHSTQHSKPPLNATTKCLNISQRNAYNNVCVLINQDTPVKALNRKELASNIKRCPVQEKESQTFNIICHFKVKQINRKITNTVLM